MPSSAKSAGLAGSSKPGRYISATEVVSPAMPSRGKRLMFKLGRMTDAIRPSSGVSELQALLSPISCEEFVNSFFSRASVFIEGGPEKIGNIFSWEKLNKALERGQKIQDKRYNIHASFARGDEAGSKKEMVEASHQQVDSLFKSGATICITNIHMADPDQAQWAQALRTQLNFTGTVGVNCYFSPDGVGLSTHYDKRVVTNLQIAGKKRWRYSTKAAKHWPDHNAVYQDGKVEPADAGMAPPDMEFREVEMKPGDLLCLPAGAWHSAQASRGESLAINVYFQPQNFLEQLIPLLKGFAASNGEWRAGTPASLDQVRGETPAEVSGYTRERLREFHELAAKLLENPQAMVEPWLSASTHFPYTGWQPRPLASLQGLTNDQRFRVANSSLRFVQAQDKLIVPCENNLLRFPLAAGPVLSRLASESGTFTMHDVLAWGVRPLGPDPQKVLSYLQILIENRIVEPATSPRP
jgi:ribosomal protein L16 Arg81 hydroxylase